MTSTTDFFAALRPQPADPLLKISSAYRADPRPQKLDLGLGVFRDEHGRTPVLRAVKAAESMILERQTTKAYVGAEGDLSFVAAIRRLIFGGGGPGADVFGMQTPGGTGALRLAAELAHAARPAARIWLGEPSWPIHREIFRRAGLQVMGYPHVAPDGRLDGGALFAAAERAQPGDLFLLHGSCHNPTGLDVAAADWTRLASIFAERGVVPLVDFAYHGLGDTLEADAAPLRALFERSETALLAYSCDKNFGLYRERTGAFFARARHANESVRTNALAIARCCWSMPPDHGAAVVATILESPPLRALWESEVAAMRTRLHGVRTLAGAAHPALARLPDGRGLFAVLALAPEAIDALAREHAVYLAASGRINVAGLTPATISYFARALEACLSTASP